MPVVFERVSHLCVYVYVYAGITINSVLLAAGCSWSVARAFVRAYKSNSSLEVGSLVPQAPTRTIQRVPCPFPVPERHCLPTIYN
jgi:hypothetical protein